MEGFAHSHRPLRSEDAQITAVERDEEDYDVQQHDAEHEQNAERHRPDQIKFAPVKTSNQFAYSDNGHYCKCWE